MRVQIHQSWENKLTFAFAQPDLKRWLVLLKAVQAPPLLSTWENDFEAFNACPFEEVKVVVLGQDPYHGPGRPWLVSLCQTA